MNELKTIDSRPKPPREDDSGGVKTPANGKLSFFTSLSGKLLLMTILFVMIAEVMVFVPSVANFRVTWLKERLHTAEAVSLVFDENQAIDLPQDMQDELLKATQAEAIALRSFGAARLIASDTMPSDVARHVIFNDNSMSGPLESIMDAFDTLINGGDRAIRVVTGLKNGDGDIEIVMKDGPLRSAMLTYARNVMLLSLVISLITAFFVFLSIRWLLIRPIQHMTTNMMDFSREPENSSRIITPSSRNDEIGMAEEQLAGMQDELQTTLQSQKHLANLGLAVSKINHDLRNILASAQLFSDRLTALPDPTVQRLAPKLIRTIDRAISYTQSVLSYGRAIEAAPERRLIRLSRVIDDLVEMLGLDRLADVTFMNDVPDDLEIDADAEQLFRVLHNLARNAIQAMQQNPVDAHVNRLNIAAYRQDSTALITVSDTGPGVPDKAREKLFEAFSGSTRAGGTGLGLAIAAEIIHAHGGEITLENGCAPGSTFIIRLPDQPINLEAARSLKSAS